MTYENVKQVIKDGEKEKLRDLLDKGYFDEEAIEAAISLGISLNDFEEAYSGKFSNDAEFAENMAEELGDIPQAGSSEWPLYCIDWAYAAKELMYDYAEESGYYFRNL
jgi:antirestriction protein